MSRPVRYLLAAAALVITAGVAYYNYAAIPAIGKCPGTTPSAVVQSYYAATARHDEADALACLTPHYRDQALNFADPDWENISSIQLVRVQQHLVDPQAANGDFPQPSAQVFQVTVEYDVQWGTVESEQNGPGLAFIYVGRDTPQSPWRIDGIGSGP